MKTGLFNIGMATSLGEGKLTLCRILLVWRCIYICVYVCMYVFTRVMHVKCSIVKIKAISN